jgi:hypothetical protein
VGPRGRDQGDEDKSAREAAHFLPELGEWGLDLGALPRTFNDTPTAGTADHVEPPSPIQLKIEEGRITIEVHDDPRTRAIRSQAQQHADAPDMHALLQQITAFFAPADAPANTPAPDIEERAG